MPFTFTEEQKKVIAHRDGDLLVSAAAGSGKTTVLVQRVLSMMRQEHPVSILNMLIMTFTRDAANQMKEKIQEKIADALKTKADPFLEEQFRLVGLAHIETNHAFSLYVTRNFITLLDDVDPGFRIADESEAALVRSDVLQKVLEEHYTRALRQDLTPDDENFLSMVTFFSGAKRDSNVEEVVLRVYDFLLKIPDPETWLTQAVERYNVKAWTSLPEGMSVQEASKIETLSYPALKGLMQVVLDFRDAYAAEKNRRNFLEISDCEPCALRILQNEAVCRQLRRQFAYIYVDEYQDCSPIQQAIIDRIAHKNKAGQNTNVFMVGDVRQSIYSFRQADPTLFLDKYDHYGKIPDTRRILLKENFRSSQPVVDAVNQVFSFLMRREVGGLDYGRDEELVYSREMVTRHIQQPCLTVVEKVGLSADELFQLESAEIARKVQDLLLRGRKPSEIVILMRAVKGRGAVLQKTLENAGIHVSCETSENFYDTPEIKTIVSLLEVIDNPLQDIPLMGVMISPAGRFTEDDLGVIRLAARDVPYFEALKAFAAQDSRDKLHQKARTFLTRLSKYRDYAAIASIPDLLWYLYTDTGYYLYASAMPGGALRQKNLDLLLSKACSFEKGTYSGLYEFLRYLDKIQKTHTEEDEGRVLDETENMVRITTIHKSKGLEYPVVIIAGLGVQFNQNDLRSTILLDHESGIGVNLIDGKLGVSQSSLMYKNVAEQKKKAQMAEEMRLLYVAMTRAEDELYLFGSRSLSLKKDTDEIMHPDFSGPLPLTADEIMQAKSSLDWLERIESRIAPDKRRLYYIELVLGETHHGEENGQPGLPGTEQGPDRKANKGSGAVRPAAASSAATEEAMAYETFRGLLSYQYPRAWLTKVPRLLSVSELKKDRMTQVLSQIDETSGQDIISFDILTRQASQAPTAREDDASPQGAGDIGSRRGTAFHTIVARYPLKKLAQDDPSLIRANLIHDHFLTQEEADLVPNSWITGFQQSNLLQRMLSSASVSREEPFIMQMPLSDLRSLSDRFDIPDTDDAGKETVMVQGVIDCFFEDNGGIVLADYKTDAHLEQAQIAAYSLQLNLYQQALESATGKKVTEKFLYDVRRQREIHC